MDYTYYTIETAPEEAKSMLEQVDKGFGFVPNLFAYMAEAPTTIEAYLTLNSIIDKTSFTPGQQQVALLAASAENECDFCIAAHRAIGKMKQANQQTLDALYSNSAIECPVDAALVKFTKAVVKERGRLCDKTVNDFLDAGFTKQQVLELMIIVSIKTLSNYINHQTNPEINEELLNMV